MTVVVDAGIKLYMDSTEVVATDLWRWPTSSNTRDLVNHLSPTSTTVFNNAFDFTAGGLSGIGAQRDRLVIGARLVALSGGVANNFFRGQIAHIIVHNNPADVECVMRIHRSNDNPSWTLTAGTSVSGNTAAAAVSGSRTSGATGTATTTTLDQTSSVDAAISSAITDSSTATTSTTTSGTPATSTDSTTTSRTPVTSGISGVSGGLTTSGILGRRVQTTSATADLHLDACVPSPCAEGEVCTYDTSFCLVECTDMDECDSSPCENSAPCVNQANMNARCKTRKQHKLHDLYWKI